MVKENPARRAGHHDHSLWRSRTMRKAIEGGASGLLTKPIDFTVLREEIDARLEQAV